MTDCCLRFCLETNDRLAMGVLWLNSSPPRKLVKFNIQRFACTWSFCANREDVNRINLISRFALFSLFTREFFHLFMKSSQLLMHANVSEVFVVQRRARKRFFIIASRTAGNHGKSRSRPLGVPARVDVMDGAKWLINFHFHFETVSRA